MKNLSQRILRIINEDSKYYDVRTIVSNILSKYPGIRQTQEYKELQDKYIDYTLSCNKQEQLDWMKYYIQSGLNKFKDVSNLLVNRDYKSAKDLEYKAYLEILVAYDLM